MLTLLRDHFQHLYDLPATATDTPPDLMHQFIRTHVHHTLTAPVRTALEAPFTAEDLAVAVQSTPTGKTPGPDGLSLRYYKSFLPTLSPAWLAAFNSLSPQTLAATITLIPKPDKPVDLCTSYRPISLLNQDLKLFAKAMAMRIAHHVPSLVHPDQTGFIPGREARDNTVRAINLIHSASGSRATPTLLLSTDAERRLTG